MKAEELQTDIALLPPQPPHPPFTVAKPQSASALSQYEDWLRAKSQVWLCLSSLWFFHRALLVPMETLADLVHLDSRYLTSSQSKPFSVFFFLKNPSHVETLLLVHWVYVQLLPVAGMTGCDAFSLFLYDLCWLSIKTEQWVLSLLRCSHPTAFNTYNRAVRFIHTLQTLLCVAQFMFKHIPDSWRSL